MSIVRGLLSLVPVAMTSLCVGTTLLQAAAVVWLWSQGAFEPDKRKQYLAVLAGFDLTELTTTRGDAADQSQRPTRDQLLQARVQEYEPLEERKQAVERGTDDIRLLFQQLQTDTRRFDELRALFDAHLTQLEQEARITAIQEVKRTLEILKPKQAKELVLRMLEEDDVNDGDRVMKDVVTIITSMSPSKLKKILGEFKTPEEQAQLHQILVEIGDVGEAGPED